MGVWNKTLYYLGLVDEDAADGRDDYAAEPVGDAPYPGAPAQPTRPVGGRSRQLEFDADEPMPAVQGRRVEPPSMTRRRTVTDQALSDSGVVVTQGSSVRTVESTALESEVIVARSYADAQSLADHLRSSVPVVLDLRNVEPAMVRRLVDFSSGLTYALGGTMRKIGQGVVLVTPANVNISRDERRRLRDLGYHEAPEGL